MAGLAAHKALSGWNLSCNYLLLRSGANSMMGKSIRSIIRGLVVLSGLSLVPWAFASETEEILSGHGGGTGNSGSTVAIQSSGNAELDPKNEKKGNFQSSARFFVNGAEFAGRSTNLSSETSKTVACSYGKKDQMEYLCGNPKGLAALDAAAKVLGVPSVVIACIAAQRTFEDQFSDQGPEDKRTEEERKKEGKAKRAKYDELFKRYKRIKGDGASTEQDEADYIFDTAFDIFWMLETVAKPMKQSLFEKEPLEAYWVLVQFAVVEQFSNREAAKQFLEGGGRANIGPESQKAFAGVRKCIEAAWDQHDNKSK